MANIPKLVTAAAVAASLSGWAQPAAAQYFGQNKVQYRSFDFQVLETEHFDIHYYPEEEAVTQDVARLAERWYARLARVLGHQLSSRQPLILYASHPHFEQTNVIEGMLGEGTGGVTESFKRRIVMPVGGGLAETDHVLGHELVHAFQYDILGPNLNFPLWFIEGMAEYLSIGSHDPHTAVWLRDAALSERLPAVRDLSHPRFFPYRFGHAFWAYVGGRWGDRAVAEILQTAASPAGQRARDPITVIEQVLGISEKELSAAWHAAILSTMLRPLGDRDAEAGRRIIEPDDEQEINVGPVLSPDGSRLAFLSSRSRVSIDLYVADAATGRIERKLISTAANPHFDSLQFISSAGAWDPSGQRLAVGAIRTGRPVLALFNANNGDREREIEIPNVDEVFQPAWSPDGRQIAFSALAGGYSDLWVLDLESGAARRLTNDAFADLQPSWSPDGRRLVFLSDRFSSSLRTMQFGDYELAVMDVATGRSTRLPAFQGIRHNSPQWSREGIYFIAYPDGVPDVYRIGSEGGAPVRVTRLVTGATAITPTSPALSIAAGGTRLAVVVYRNATYEIQAVEGAQLRGLAPAPVRATVDAGQLPPVNRLGEQVDPILAAPDFGLPADAARSVEEYDAKLSLDYIGQEFGVTTFNSLGGYVGGGIAMSFSDMLGDHLVTSLVQVNGGFEDFGGQVGYLNRTRRWNWGGFVEQIPYVTGGVFGGVETIDGRQVFVEQLVRDRTVDRRVMGLTQYPFSRARRIEFGASLRHLSFNRDIDTRGFALNTGQLLFEDQQDVRLADPLTLGELTAAFVHDTSLFGATGPILGHRSRFEVSPAFGDLRFTNVIADARHYVMPFTPLTIAARALHIGRYGADAESLRLSPLFVGFPSLVRGYDAGSFDFSDCEINPVGGCATVEQLIGSRLLVTGVELRAPLVGLFTGALEYGPLPVELIGFFDAGVAWDESSRPAGFGNGTRPWARSVGTGVRVNAFGYMILELNAVRPLDRVDNSWRFVFGIRPGF
ncbi:MAG TPA: BamA/TamA family outer membrane protein [Vicinamibacterales bacterium]|nr:BamA/TamA family outer membrane protein [Vicinamibacterales bacterium]